MSSTAQADGTQPSVAIKPDSHEWRPLKRPAYCNVCRTMLGKGLRCTLCKYTAHTSCAPKAACVATHITSANKVTLHHWVEGNCAGRCALCGKGVGRIGIRGLRCRWCKEHIMPPTCLQHDADGEATDDDGATVKTGLSLRARQPSENVHPLLVFINPKSGGQHGVEILRKMRYLLNPLQVCDLSTNGGPTATLELFHSVRRQARLLVCGGDGTIAWLQATMDALGWEERPPMAFLPMGTYNTLSRYLRWSGGYSGEDLSKVLQRIECSRVVMMDRFSIAISDDDADATTTAAPVIPLDTINVYFSIGGDALVFHKIHALRQAQPHLFSSRLGVRAHYMKIIMRQSRTVEANTMAANLHRMVSVTCDGNEVPLSEPLNFIGFANLPSVHGFPKAWREESPPAHLSDGLLQIIAVDTAARALRILYCRGAPLRLARGSTIRIRTHETLPMHVDGEPWMQPPCTVSASTCFPFPVDPLIPFLRC